MSRQRFRDSQRELLRDNLFIIASLLFLDLGLGLAISNPWGNYRLNTADLLVLEMVIPFFALFELCHAWSIRNDSTCKMKLHAKEKVGG